MPNITTGHRPRVAAIAVLTSTGILLTACAGSDPTTTRPAQSVATTSTQDVEPTGTYLPRPEPANLFDLLVFTGDYPVYQSAPEQIAALEPQAALLGEVVSVSEGATEPFDGGPGITTAVLLVRPERIVGSVPEAPDGLLRVEAIRPSMVTQGWFDLAVGYRDVEILLIVNDGRAEGNLRLSHPMSLYREVAPGGIEPPLGGQAPADLRELTLDQAFAVLEPLITSG